MIEKTRERRTARAPCACRSIRRGERNPITANWAPWGDGAAGYREAVRKARVPCCSRSPTSRGLRRSTAAREANLRKSSTRTPPCTDRCNDICSCEIERIMLEPYGRGLKEIAGGYASDHSTVAKQSNRAGGSTPPALHGQPGGRMVQRAARTPRKDGKYPGRGVMVMPARSKTGVSRLLRESFSGATEAVLSQDGGRPDQLARFAARVPPPCRRSRPASAQAGAHDPVRGSAMSR